jgi:threonine synthase
MRYRWEMPEISLLIGRVKTYVDTGQGKDAPKDDRISAEGGPIVRGRGGSSGDRRTAIRIGNPSWKAAEAARDQSGGLIDMVSDQEILDAYRMVSSTEGVFCEPASGVNCGVLKKSKEGYFQGR